MFLRAAWQQAARFFVLYSPVMSVFILCNADKIHGTHSF